MRQGQLNLGLADYGNGLKQQNTCQEQNGCPGCFAVSEKLVGGTLREP